MKAPKKAVLTRGVMGHQVGEVIEVIEFKGSGLYRVRFSDEDTGIIGVSSFTILGE